MVLLCFAMFLLCFAMILLCAASFLTLSSSPLLRLHLSDVFRGRAPTSKRPVQTAAPVSDISQLMSGVSCLPPVLCLSTNAVQLTVHIGDDGQLMSAGSCLPPVLCLSTNAVWLTFPVGDHGQLMSAGSCPPLWYKCCTADRPYRRRRPADVRWLLWPARPMLSTNGVQILSCLRCTLCNCPFFFCIALCCSSGVLLPFSGVGTDRTGAEILRGGGVNRQLTCKTQKLF